MNTIKCNQCGHEIEVTEALKKDIESQIMAQVSQKHEQEISKIKLENSQNLEKTKAEIQKKAIEKANKAYEDKIKITKDEAQERQKQNIELQNQLVEISKQLRSAKDAEGKMKVEFEKKLLAEQDKIKLTAKKEIEDELGLKMAEKDKKIVDMEKQVQEMKRKLEQGSQQTQGEVLELELEQKLKTQFPFDEIKEVPKGVKGADIIQIVKTRSGSTCGTIVWELKNTKTWQAGWIQKLTDDQRALKAEIGILVSTALPENINNFGQINNIWVSDINSSFGLAHVLRQQLIAVANTALVNRGKETKAEKIYNYLTSTEFKQRIEVWVEHFKNRQADITKERMYFTKKWEKDDKEMLKIMENTAGIYGDIQGVIGNALPRVEYLELPEIEDEENDEEIEIKSKKKVKESKKQNTENSEESLF